MNSVFNLKKKQPLQSEKCIWALQSQPKSSKIRYRNNLVFSAKNMVYSTSDHKRKHFQIFLQNKNKKMETRNQLIHHVKRPSQSLVRHLWWNVLRVLITAWARGLFLLEAAPRMFERVLNTPLIFLKLLSLSTIYEEAYSEPSQAFGMDLSARVIGLGLWIYSGSRFHLGCLNGFWVRLWCLYVYIYKL